VTGRRKTVNLPEQDEPQREPEAVAPHLTTNVEETRLVEGDVSEYETADGATFLLTPDDAKRLGAKAVSKPANKAVTPSNK
jgi:hypothetical protein